MRANGCTSVLLLALTIFGLAHPVASAQSSGCEDGKTFMGKVYQGDAAALLGDPPLAISGPLPKTLVDKLDAALDEILAESGAPAVTAAVAVPGRGRWAASRGLATLSPPQPLLPDARFWWASVGKAFTVATVLSLIQDGKLTDSDRLARWYPGYPNAQTITIEQMMTHTSGIGSFPDPGADFRTAMEYVSPEEIIRRTADRGGVIACPGERWSYSNTAMVMLGQIIERIEGRPFHEVVATRLIGPLGLKRMIAAPPRPNLADIPREHINGEPLPVFNAMTYSAGNIVASAEDMVVFWHALLGGRVLPQAVIRRSLGTLYPLERGSISPVFRTDAYFGRGVMLFEAYTAADEAPRHWLGHVGGGFGSTGLVFQEVESGVFLAVAFNAPVDRAAAAEKLLKIVRPEARR